MAKEPVYFIIGEDEFRVNGRARELVNELVPEADRALGLETIDGAVDNEDDSVAALRQTLEAIQTLGFFGGGKTVWLRDAAFFGLNRASSSDSVKSLVKVMSELVKSGLPDWQKLIISSANVLKTGSLYKAVKANGELFEYASSAKPYEMEKLAAERVNEEAVRVGLKFSEGARQAFLAKVGFDSRLISSEMEKLCCYKGEETQVSQEDVAAITSTGRDAVPWDLPDAFGARDLPKALAVLSQLLFQRESGVRLVLTLSSRISDLSIMREAMDKRWVSVSFGRYTNVNWSSGSEIDAVMGSLEKDPRKIHSFRQGLLAQQAKQFSMAELKRARYYVLQAHETLVSETVPAQNILELLLLRLLPGGGAR